MYRRGDFHIHSKYSDGSLRPYEIVDMAAKRKLDIISITDHNSIDGIDEAMERGRKRGIKVIPGVEISARYGKSRVHILAYFPNDNYKDERFKKFLTMVKHGKTESVRKMFKQYVDLEKWRGKLSAGEVISILKFFGAVVVLAHPVLMSHEDFKRVMSLPFDGIEAKYYRNTREDTKYFIKLASQKKLIYTAGSDFHRMDNDDKHGMIGDVYLNKDEIRKFMKKMRS